MAYQISCRVDRELELAIHHYGKQNGLTRSQTIRELLRQAATDASPLRRGWHEGFAAGHAEYQQTLHRHIAGVTIPE